MAGIITEDYSTSPRCAVTEGMSSELQCQSGDSIAEWRSSEQVENGTPSTSPLYWDSDDDDVCGPKPSELYGRFNWKIENFSTINKRELRSNAFEVGGYKWYILIYPQGCDVCNHLSLFLCVANHDKLLPGWSHFAQFTIAVVNKDPKKSKYSDTLHRFWKKEHDWGWKKFMELSKVYDGFIVADTLVIKAQVQVIREKAHRPFRCLDCQYRRELVRVYLSNVEQICQRFVEERREKLKKLVEDKLRWPSFRAFWIGIDADSRRHMSRDKTDVILKVVVKHFFIEKEVTSTLVMDSLYSGLKALECQSKNKKGRAKLIDVEELPAPMVRVDKDTFVLADDVLSLLERAASEPLPHQPLPPKDDKCSQNRTKEGSSGEEFNKDSIERDERRLMELGRRTVEIFVLAHIFSRIEVSYQEAVALKRQEELIREEEAAWQAENELRAKRGANEKDKRAKKKQAKQKRNSRKGKDKGRDERSDVVGKKVQPVKPSLAMLLEDFLKPKKSTMEKTDTIEDASDLSDNGVDVVNVLQHDLDVRDSSPNNCDADTSEIQQTLEASCSNVHNGKTEKGRQSVMDDSSSTCSTDSVPSVVMNGPSKGKSLPNNKNHSSTNRGKIQRSKGTCEQRSSAHTINALSDAATGETPSSVVSGSKVCPQESGTVELSLKNETKKLQKHDFEKEAEVVSLHKNSSAEDNADEEKSSKPSATETFSLSPGKKPYTLNQPNQSLEIPATTNDTTAAATSSSNSSSNSISQSDKLLPLPSKVPPVSGTSKSDTLKPPTPVKSTTAQNSNASSRPSSAPLIPVPRPTAPAVSTVCMMPLLSRSISAAGRLGNEPSSSAPSYVPQSYRNVIMGKNVMAAGAATSAHHAASSSQASTYSQSPSTVLSSALVLPPQASVRIDQTSGKSGFTFGSIKPEVHPRNLLRDGVRGEASSSGRYSSDNIINNMEKLDIYEELQKREYSVENASMVAPHQAQGLVSEEFPHLDIINDLLDEEQNSGRIMYDHHHTFNRQYSFPGHASSMDVAALNGTFRFDQSEPYYDEYFQRSYGSSSTLQRRLAEGHFSQADLSSYANGQFEGVMQNRWPYVHADLSMLNVRNEDVNRYSYQLPDYSSLAGGVNGYMYPPANRP